MLFGQDWNDEAWAVCKSDMLIKGEDADNIILGDTFTKDGFDRDAEGQEDDLRLHARQSALRRGVEAAAALHRAGARHPRLRAAASAPGLPRINDGALLFLQHMLSKMRAPAGRRQPHRHRLQRLAALHRRRRQRREQHPPLDHRERLAGGHRRPARPALLQHRHLHLHLGAHQPQGDARARARCSSSTPASSA